MLLGLLHWLVATLSLPRVEACESAHNCDREAGVGSAQDNNNKGREEFIVYMY